jgi:hypothetical protein
MRGSAVHIRGLVRGMGHEAECDVLVHKRVLGSAVQYTEGVIIYGPAGLPDGEYLVHFDGHVMHATKQHARWVYSNHITHQLLEQSAAA